MSAFHRLSALDAMFVGIETSHRHMHVGAMLVFACGPLCRPDGSVDIDRLSQHVEQTLTTIPHYRRRLREVPYLRHPGWVDDEHFNLHYHLRHVALPKPGSNRQLKDMAGRIFSEPLDRERPLWEMYVVEGLEGGRFALIGKVHHAMVDGVAGVEMIARLLRGTADASIEEVEATWVPEPAPRGSSLLRSELHYRKEGLLRLARRARENWEAMRSGAAHSVRDTITGISAILSSGLIPASGTAINPPHVGPHRRFDSCRFALVDLKEIKDSLGGKLNDVILALCAGALRRYLLRMGDIVDLHKNFRVLMPVSTRGDSQSSTGNKIALTLVPLPVHLCEEEDRYAEVLRGTTEIKENSHQARGVSFLEDLSDVTLDALIREGVHVAGMLRPYNVIITNVPGPPFELFLLGSKLEEMVPFVPLFDQQALGIAVFSYAGQVFIGLGADWHSLSNLDELTDDFKASFEELQALARSRSASSSP